MAKMNDENYYDCVVIGAGLGGLTVGNILAYNGYKTVIIDKNAQPGGYVINFRRKDYRFDVPLHFINGCGTDGMVGKVLKSFGAENIVEWLPIERLIHWVDTGNKYDATPPVPLNEYTEFLCREFPHEEKNIRKFINRYSKIMPTLFSLMEPGLGTKIKNFFKGLPTMFRMMSIAFSTVDKVINKNFKDPALIGLLTNFCYPFGMRLDETSFLLWCFSEFSYRLEGAWYPKGGAGEFTGALARHFQKNGGQLLLNHEVTFIDVKKRLAEAVICKDKKGNEKRFIPAAVCNATDQLRLATKLVPEGTFKKSWIKKIQSKDIINSMFIVYLGLNIDLKKLGVEDYELWRLNREFYDEAHFDKVENKRDFSELPIDIITFYSNGPDKSCCPPGKSVVSTLTTTKYEAFLDLLEENGEKGEKYYKFKKEAGQLFVKRLGELINYPDLMEAVEVMEVATPMTLQRYSYARQGAPIGWRFDVNSGVKKMQLFGTRVKNLTLAGNQTFPSGGMSAVIMGGQQAAKATIKRINKYKKRFKNR